MIDDISIEALELSVGTTNMLENAGVRTIGQLRVANLSKMKSKWRKEVRDVLKEWDALAPTRAAERVVAARAALAKVTQAERVILFHETGTCACSKTSTSAAIGAFAGTALGALFFPNRPVRPVNSFKPLADDALKFPGK